MWIDLWTAATGADFKLDEAYGRGGGPGRTNLLATDDCLELWLRRLASYVYNARSGDEVGGAHMPAVNLQGSGADLARAGWSRMRQRAARRSSSERRESPAHQSLPPAKGRARVRGAETRQAEERRAVRAWARRRQQGPPPPRSERLFRRLCVLRCPRRVSVVPRQQGVGIYLPRLRLPSPKWLLRSAQGTGCFQFRRWNARGRVGLAAAVFATVANVASSCIGWHPTF